MLGVVEVLFLVEVFELVMCELGVVLGVVLVLFLIVDVLGCVLVWLVYVFLDDFILGDSDVDGVFWLWCDDEEFVMVLLFDGGFLE